MGCPTRAEDLHNICSIQKGHGESRRHHKTCNHKGHDPQDWQQDGVKEKPLSLPNSLYQNMPTALTVLTRH